MSAQHQGSAAKLQYAHASSASPPCCAAPRSGDRRRLRSLASVSEEKHHHLFVRLPPHVDRAVHFVTRFVPVNLACSDPHVVRGTAGLALDREPTPAQNHGDPMAQIPMPCRCLTRFQAQATHQNGLPPIEYFLAHRPTLARTCPVRQNRQQVADQLVLGLLPKACVPSSLQQRPYNTGVPLFGGAVLLRKELALPVAQPSNRLAHPGEVGSLYVKLATAVENEA
jgi:hypothetical protein